MKYFYVFSTARLRIGQKEFLEALNNLKHKEIRTKKFLKLAKCVRTAFSCCVLSKKQSFPCNPWNDMITGKLQQKLMEKKSFLCDAYATLSRVFEKLRCLKKTFEKHLMYLFGNTFFFRQWRFYPRRTNRIAPRTVPTRQIFSQEQNNSCHPNLHISALWNVFCSFCIYCSPTLSCQRPC